MDEQNQTNEVVTTTEQTNNVDSQQDTKTFTTEEVNAIVQKRLAREIAKERKTWESTLEEEKKKSTMSETERLKAQNEELLQKYKTITQAANDKLLKAEFKSVANELGIADMEIAYMLFEKDIDKADLQDEDGNINVEELKKSLETLVAKKPILKGQVQIQSANLPGNPSVTTKSTLTVEQIKRMTPEQINANWLAVQAALKK